LKSKNDKETIKRLNDRLVGLQERQSATSWAVEKFKTIQTSSGDLLDIGPIELIPEEEFNKKWSEIQEEKRIFNVAGPEKNKD